MAHSNTATCLAIGELDRCNLAESGGVRTPSGSQVVRVALLPRRHLRNRSRSRTGASASSKTNGLQIETHDKSKPHSMPDQPSGVVRQPTEPVFKRVTEGNHRESLAEFSQAKTISNCLPLHRIGFHWPRTRPVTA